jgi:hypothetical protein
VRPALARPLVDASSVGEAVCRRPVDVVVAGGRRRDRAFAMPAAGGLPCAMVGPTRFIADATAGRPMRRMALLFLLPIRLTGTQQYRPVNERSNRSINIPKIYPANEGRRPQLYIWLRNRFVGKRARNYPNIRSQEQRCILDPIAANLSILFARFRPPPHESPHFF